MSKEELLQHCWMHLEERSETIQKQMKGLQDSLNSETKSSAGDKHETGRAMVQLEQEKLGQQLLEVEKTRAILQRIDITKSSNRISLGSLVKTNTASYFISISCGAFQKANTTIYCVSAKAPIAQLLMGKAAGEEFHFNGKHFTILEVE
ncbi:MULTISPECIES: 3-oxoacyl-ACP synthase [Flavobacteriaceae]|uniref:3-oxoacyl-ACP synthase n=1 Tax=Flavobacteriaceae TaxID=49546 RepID=UPI001491B1B6|nr:MULTISPECIES: 3-oxoacyl-ACP synthase [Allomuricauda]MDC6365237.1 3-oxoacyl-ACP synthase [Muricauda sp. AC10]